ncbi:S-layer homology domain-containing protein [Proteiniborus ethanoligenes]|uniref:S-layer homology domain-containing protein n=1 Tax=Proteiniborus ethanoligenes TaxID=415015 RepID=A0A1H3LZQ9_9FIRM|nr:S-layer homology domain-containing protein [Proteiniborus ethanoligenes]SDY69920.1 S-layer homology domain-containing protein [Proteiniborus ethanoligenes]
MLKKTTILVLVFVLAFGGLVFAKNTDTQKLEAAERLVAMGIITGFEDGSLGLEGNLTREQFATIVVRLMNKQNEVDKYKQDSIFSDVKKERWSAGYVNIAVKEGLIVGRGDGTFDPQGNITHAEILTVLVRLLGYEGTIDKNKAWPDNYVDKAKELKMDLGAGFDIKSPALRGDIMLYIDKSLVVKINR